MSAIHAAATDHRFAVPAPYVLLVEQLSRMPGISVERSGIVEAAIGVWRRPGFDTFASLSQLNFEPFEHQLRAGAVVLSLRGGDFLFESGEDVSLGYSHHDADSVHLYLEESFSFRVATPEAAVALRSPAS